MMACGARSGGYAPAGAPLNDQPFDDNVRLNAAVDHGARTIAQVGEGRLVESHRLNLLREPGRITLKITRWPPSRVDPAKPARPEPRRGSGITGLVSGAADLRRESSVVAGRSRTGQRSGRRSRRPCARPVPEPRVRAPSPGSRSVGHVLGPLMKSSATQSRRPPGVPPRVPYRS